MPSRGVFRTCATVLILLIVLAGGNARGQEQPLRKLRVGTKEAAPFSMKDPDVGWTGITVELWKELAAELGLRFEFEERPIAGLFEGLADGSLDVALGALTVTAAREGSVDFTHSYFSSGLGIAVPRQPQGGWVAVARRLLSSDFLRVLGLLVVLLLGTGVLIWVFERRRNREQFGGSPLQGLGAGFWWSAVTMTTVGYGDKAPRTLAGRLVALVWMFACIVFISGLTATIASTLTVSRLEGSVNGPDDLVRARVGTVPGTTSEGHLRARQIRYRSYPTPVAALEALADGDLDAVVYDKPLLRWNIRERFADRLTVLPALFRAESYAIGLREGSPHREALNRLLPEKTSGKWWDQLLLRFLGP